MRAETEASTSPFEFTFQMKIENVQLDQIDIYGGTQTRAATNDEVISSYAEAMEAGDEFPPIVVFYDGARYWLADGFHRFLARKRTQHATIQADVREGGRTDALTFALSANATNGLHRSNADKRNAVETALEEWPERSNAVIAELCRVSIDLVRKCRTEMEKLNLIDEPTHVVGKDGKNYPTAIEREPRGKTEKRSSEGGGGGGRPKKGKGDGSGVGGSNMEIEAEARKMIRDGEMDPRELTNIHSATAIDYAQAAIQLLSKIPEDDPKRGDAFRMLRRWIDARELGLQEDPVSSASFEDDVAETSATFGSESGADDDRAPWEEAESEAEVSGSIDADGEQTEAIEDADIEEIDTVAEKDAPVEFAEDAEEPDEAIEEEARS